MSYPISYAGGEHTLHKTSGGKIRSAGACGLGWCRQLPLDSSLFKFRPVHIPSHVKLVYASYYHNLALVESGKLYSWGCGTFTEGNLDGVIPALGQGRLASDVGKAPTEVTLPLKKDEKGNVEKVVDITGGAYHSAVLLNTGRILTFGAGQLGQLGRKIGKEGADASNLPVDPEPREAEVPPVNGMKQKIKKLGSGFYNTFAISSEGKLFCTGENQNKQCGVGPKNLNSMTQVKEMNDEVVHQVEGGYCHTLVKTLSGKAFSFGCGDDGQRGINDHDQVATQVTLPTEAKQVAAGANHSVILGKDGHVYTFGANDVGQCGVQSDPRVFDDDDDDEEDDGDGPVYLPKKVDLPKDAGEIIHISAGYAHTVLSSKSGKTFVFGQNDNGQLGFGGESIDRGEDPEKQVRPVEVSTDS